LSHVDETGLRESSSVDNKIDSDEESQDDENDSVDEIDAEDDFGKFDDQNQLYVLEMILRFHALYKCGSPYVLGTEEGNKMIDEGI